MKEFLKSLTFNSMLFFVGAVITLLGLTGGFSIMNNTFAIQENLARIAAIIIGMLLMIFAIWTEVNSKNQQSKPAAKEDKEDKDGEKNENSVDLLSGTWGTKWIYPEENGEDRIIEDRVYIKMTGGDRFEGNGKGANEEWNYTFTGIIDEMGFLSGVWISKKGKHKGAFLLKLHLNATKAEGHVLSTAFEKNTRAGKWLWELETR